MTPIELIRHGSTSSNTEGESGEKIRGWNDIPLSEKGEEEAAQLAYSLRNSGLTSLVHSDLTRAASTANAIHHSTGANMISSPLLRTWNVGRFVDRPSKEADPLLERYVVDHPNTPPPEGESFNTFRRRVFQGLSQALSVDPKGYTGVVTHNKVERLLQAWNKNGQPPDGSIHLPTFFKAGEEPAGSERFMVNEKNLAHNRSFHTMLSGPRDSGREARIRPQEEAVRP